MIDEVVKHFGRLDAVFTNAGVFEVNAPGSESPDDIFQRVLEVNLWAFTSG
jgi:NAD(P)-dependent dehydrogenase (short-subunit alcohol dehydrogenase family)